MELGRTSADKKTLTARYGNVFDLLVILICLTSFGFSYIEAMVNSDSYHWGYAFGPALDLYRGAAPYSQSFLAYGFISTMAEVAGLFLFGQRLMSLGMITGLFYALSLFFSYRIFLRFMPKVPAFLSVLFIFLIHPYVIYPGANYIAYTFLLLGLLFFLRWPEGNYNGFLAGLFLCLAVLSRFSLAIAYLPPFAVLLCWELFINREDRRTVLRKIMLVSLGFFIPLILFFGYLVRIGALGDFFYQNITMIKIWGRLDSPFTYLNFLSYIFQINTSPYAYDFRGRIFTLVLAFSVFLIIREIRRWKSNGEESIYADYNILAVSVVTVFGFLDSLRIYETFRLVNSASIGVGVCVLFFYNFYSASGKTWRYLTATAGILVLLYLSSTLLFTQTTSAYYPWRKDVLFGGGVSNNTIGIFKGKLLSRESNNFYQGIYDAVAPFENTYYIINFTTDGVALLINDLPRVQKVPNHHPWFEDVQKQATLIEQNKAVILSYKKLDWPGYKEIFAKSWPDEIPWLGGGCLFIYAPAKGPGG